MYLLKHRSTAALALLSSGFLPLAQALDPPKAAAVAAAAGKPAASAQILALDWEELVPKDARSRFAAGAPPAPVHDYLGEGGMAAQQVMDFSVNKQLDGASVKIPGFIVPLDIGKDGLVSEFSWCLTSAPASTCRRRRRTRSYS